MATVVSHLGVHRVIGKPRPLSGKVEQKPVDDVWKDKLSIEGDSNNTESWCYWVPFPGVRYYCFGQRASAAGPIEQSRQGLPT